MRDYRALDQFDPQTDANLHAAILSVGRLLQIGSMAESIVDHIKDRMRSTLSPAQRHDPTSIYTTQVLGLVTDYVRETYGIDKPANIHGPVTGIVAHAAGEPAFFDALGRTPYDRMVAGNRLAGFYSGSTIYSGLAGTTYDPARGLSSLTPQNFDSSPFKAAGLDYTTTRMLAAQGFGPQAIIAAASLTGSLGIDVKTNVAAVARLTRDVPGAETGLRQTKRNWEAVAQLESEAKKARDRGDAETADRLQREADEARRRAEEHDRRERDRARTANPDREQDLIGVQQQIRDQALKAARDAKIDPALIERMRQGDPAAKEEFDRIVEGIKAGTDPKTRAGVEQVQEAVDADKKLRATVVPQNQTLAAVSAELQGQVTQQVAENDADLDALNNDPPPAEPAAQPVKVTEAPKATMPQKKPDPPKVSV
jgi:hypothetical protein